MRTLLALLAVAGCDKVLSLDDITVSPGALTVHGNYGVRRVLNSASRLPYTSDDLPAGRAPQGAFVQLADGNKAQLVWGADDHFYFNRADATQAYRIVFPGVDPLPTIEYQLAVDQVALLDRVWGRTIAQRVLPSLGTKLHYAVTMPTGLANPLLLVASSGIWTQTVVDSTQTVDWPNAVIAADAGPVALLDARPDVNNDRAYCLIYDRPSGASYTRLYYYHFDDITLLDAAVTTPPPAAPFAINADTCIALDAKRADEIQRITMAGYVGSAAATAGWELNAVPVLAMGTEVNFLVAYDNGTTNASGQLRFGLPFDGYDLVLQMSATAPHALMAPGAAAPYPASFGETTYIQPLTTTTCTDPTSFGSGVVLPNAPLLDGAELGDTVLQLDRSRLAKLTWTPNAPGAPAHLYRADLYEVYANANNMTALRPRATWLTTNHTLDGNAEVLVDPALLQFGKSYAIEIMDVLGYSAADSGDLTTISYPYTLGFAWTGVLQIAN